LIHFDQTHTIKTLAELGVEVDHGDFRKGVSFSSDFSEAEEGLISDAGFRYEVLISDVSNYYAHQTSAARQTQTRSSSTCSNTSGYNIAIPNNFRGGSMGGFLTYQEMLDQLDSMKVKYPNLISARHGIDTFRSIEGRPIYWLRISNHPDSNQSAKPQILYTAVHHAREPAGLTDIMFYMWHLLENYQTSAEVRELVDNTEMYIIPCVNPDGYIYNQTTNPNGGGLWRKNRRHNSDSTYGVDLNRNYGYNWGYDNTGSSPTTTSETYRGTAGFSEPETQATKWFAEHHNFRLAINYHTYSNMLVYPWGYQASFLCPDSAIFSAYATTMTRKNHFLYGTADQTVGYTTNGDSDDWMYGDQNTVNKIFSMTPEAGSATYGFWPPASAVVDVCKGNFDLIYSAHKFLLKYVEVNDLSPRLVTSSQFWFKYQAQRLGLDSPGTYTISLSTFDPNVTVPASIKTIINPALLAQTIDSFQITLSSSIPSNSDFRFIVAVSNGGYIYYDTITKRYISGDTIYYNNCNSVNAFTFPVGWGATSTSYTSPSASITDSPFGNYADNTNSTLTLINNIDLRAATDAKLLYQAKWQLEKDYDYTLIEASSDSGTWDALCGLYTSYGTNQNNLTQSLYDGYQNDWVKDVADLNSYLGKKVQLRFHLVSDQNTNYDGFYFDDLTVLGKIDSTLLNSITDIYEDQYWQLYPNPATNKVNIHPASMNGEEATIYNALGDEIRKVKVQNNQINIEGLNAGVYSVSFLKKETLHIGATRKLVIIE
jgi:hypothetical protein